MIHPFPAAADGAYADAKLLVSPHEYFKAVLKDTKNCDAS